MQTFIPYLIVLFLAYATGIFYVLSMIEKPIWGYLYRHKPFPDKLLMRHIHGQLKRLITLLPPTMVSSMLCATLLIIYQFISLKTLSALLVMVIFLCGLASLVLRLKSRIDGVKSINSDADYATLERGVIRLAQLHHEGLFTVLLSLLLQLGLVIM